MDEEDLRDKPRGRPRVNRRFLESAFQSQQLLKELVGRRKRLHLSQTEVAMRMGTSQSAIARIETAGMDIRLSTLERYAAAIGQKVNFKLTRLPAGRTSGQPPATEADPPMPEPAPSHEPPFPAPPSDQPPSSL